MVRAKADENLRLLKYSDPALACGKTHHLVDVKRMERTLVVLSPTTADGPLDSGSICVRVIRERKFSRDL